MALPKVHQENLVELSPAPVRSPARAGCGPRAEAEARVSAASPKQ